MQKFFKTLGQIGYKRFYMKEEMLFYEGELPRHLLVLISGKIKLYQSKKQEELVLEHLSAPKFIAEIPTLLSQPYFANASCIEDCEVLEINLDYFKTYCLKNEEFILGFLVALCEKITWLESSLASQSLNLKERVSTFLLHHHQNLSHLTQREIARSLHTSAESLSRVLKDLKQSHAITTNKGKIIITNKSLLESLLK